MMNVGDDENGGVMKRAGWIAAVTAASLGGAAQAAPEYDQGADDLKWVLARMIEWLPGEWSAFPHVHHNRTVRMPEMGEHEDWHRAIALIDAPQIGGDAVFYAQITFGDRNGAVMGRSQNIYKIWVDEERGVVVFNGQGPRDPDRFVDLHERPELWGEVQMRDESAIRCDFVWRRTGDRVFGVLEGKTEERRKYGPGTCTYFSEMAQGEFFADAEWVLGPEFLWLYDINTMDGNLFIGREDRTHTRYERTRPYACTLEDANGRREFAGHDRGFRVPVTTADGESREAMLLRMEYPDEREGRRDRLRLKLMETYPGPVLAMTDAEPVAASLALTSNGVVVECTLVDSFPRIQRDR